MRNMVSPVRFRACLIVAGTLYVLPVLAQATFPGSSAPQPGVSPTPAPPSGSPAYAPPKPSSPVVESLVNNDRPPLEVRKAIGRKTAASVPRRRLARHERIGAPDRPAVAGVELVSPGPMAAEPPHIEVPLPAYPLDSVATAVFEPPPPLVCHRAPRVQDVPDPHLYREVTLQCAPDNP